MLTTKKLIVCADDFGISQEISDGIVHGHKHGIISSTALLVNAPFTDYAISLMQTVPSLEVGLHLSFVEGYCLSKEKAPSLLDRHRYFPENPCLHRNWKAFLSHLILGKISMPELESELRLQIETFLKKVGPIPFLNSTQHLHFFPGISALVSNLCREYKIEKIRMPQNIDPGGTFSIRKLEAKILNQMAKLALKKMQDDNFPIRSPKLAFGFVHAGILNENDLMQFLNAIGHDEVAEIMAHPGFDSPPLREALPKSYNEYHWQGELDALLSPNVKLKMQELGIELTRFKNI